jgi:hypothetical protein
MTVVGRQRALGGALLAALAVAMLCTSPAASASTRGADVQTYPMGTPGVPFGFIEPLDPLFTLGDPTDEQLAFIIPIATAPVREVLAKTRWLTLGATGVDKQFRSLAWHADADPGASFEVSYSIAGGAWVVARGDGAYTFPDDGHGKTIAIRVKMSSSDAEATARFDDITIRWAKWTGKPKAPDDGPGDDKNGTGHNGSGVYNYPSAAPAAPAPAQSTGDSSYSSGVGSSGSSGGSGSGYGSGAGSGGDPPADVPEPPPEVTETAPSGEVPAPPIESSGEGAPVQVTGVLAEQDEQVVTGVPYTPSGGGGMLSGADAASAGATSDAHAPVLFISAGAATVAAILFVPWLLTAASLRELTRFSPRRARSRGPFGRIAR